jgi:hypothetical protein
MNTVTKELVFNEMKRLNRRFWRLYDSQNNLLSENVDTSSKLEYSLESLENCLNAISGQFCIVKVYNDDNIKEEGAVKAGTNQKNIMVYRVNLQGQNQSVINGYEQNKPVANNEFLDKFLHAQETINGLKTEIQELKMENKFAKLEQDMKAKYQNNDDSMINDLVKAFTNKMMNEGAPSSELPINQNVQHAPAQNANNSESNDTLKAALNNIKNTVGLDAIVKVSNYITTNPEQAQNLLNMI